MPALCNEEGNKQEPMSEKTKKSIVIQGSILAMAGIISKIIGFIYRIPMANIMGNTGNGLYSVAFGIYNIALTMSSYSMPIAVSKLMSERLADKRYKDADKVFHRALIFAMTTGIIACVVLFLGAGVIAGIYKRDGLERPLRILAPTVFVVALLGTCRGYFQGHRNMVPTAISQVIEQIVNALVSVIAAGVFVRSCVNPDEAGSYGAMGGTMGTLAGAFTALLIFIGLFIAKRGSIKQELSGTDTVTEDNALIFKCIIMTVIPVIISQTIYQFGYTLDDFLYGNILALKNVDETFATESQGVFNTQYNQMINLPVAIATAMASATLPSVVASFTIKDFDGVKSKIDTVFKTNLLIAVPACIGLAVLSDPIMAVLFSGLGEYHNMATILLSTGSTAVVFYTLSTISTSVLQGCNRMSVPVIHSGISLVIHGLLVGGLLYFTDLGVYALVIGNVSFPLLVCILNIRSVQKLIGYKFDFVGMLIKPLIAAILMGITTGLTYYGGIYLCGDDGRMMKLLWMAVAMVVAGITYGAGVIMTHAVSKEEMRRMPIIKKFIK